MSKFFDRFRGGDDKGKILSKEEKLVPSIEVKKEILPIKEEPQKGQENVEDILEERIKKNLLNRGSGCFDIESFNIERETLGQRIEKVEEKIKYTYPDLSNEQINDQITEEQIDEIIIQILREEEEIKEKEEKEKKTIKWQEERIREFLPEKILKEPPDFICSAVQRVRREIHEWNKYDHCNHFKNDKQIKIAIEQVAPRQEGVVWIWR